MRVTHIMADAGAGGGATYLKWLLPGLASHQVVSELVTSQNGSLGADISSLGFSVRELNLMRSRLSPRQTLALRREVIATAPDLIHVHGTRAAFYASAARLARRYPSVYTAHGIAFRDNQTLYRRTLMRAAEWFATRNLAGLASVSRADLTSLQGLRPLDAKCVQYIPNPVDAGQFRPGDRAQARLRLGLPVDGFVVGTVSRLVEQKAVDVLIRGFASLADATLIIVGGGPLDGPLKKLASELNANCLFLGERSDVAAILPALDVYALSSAWEGEPLSLLEAMACRLPVVTTDTPGSRDILEDGDAGLLVPIGDPQALHSAMMAYRSQPQLCTQMAARGHAIAMQRTVEHSVGLTAQLYRDCL